MPEFYMIFARKINKIPEFTIYAQKINKIPKFYVIFARKTFFPEFGGVAKAFIQHLALAPGAIAEWMTHRPLDHSEYQTLRWGSDVTTVLERSGRQKVCNCYRRLYRTRAVILLLFLGT